MAPAPDAPRRRDNDREAADLYPKVEEAIEGIARIDREIHTHTHPALQQTVDQIVDILEGPSIDQPFDQPSIRNDGLVDKVDILVTDMASVKNSLGNGGVKIKLPWPVWAAIITALGGLFVQLIETFGK